MLRRKNEFFYLSTHFSRLESPSRRVRSTRLEGLGSCTENITTIFYFDEPSRIVIPSHQNSNAISIEAQLTYFFPLLFFGFQMLILIQHNQHSVNH
jgi:hypothetical protein